MDPYYIEDEYRVRSGPRSDRRRPVPEAEPMEYYSYPGQSRARRPSPRVRYVAAAPATSDAYRRSGQHSNSRHPSTRQRPQAQHSVNRPHQHLRRERMSFSRRNADARVQTPTFASPGQAPAPAPVTFLDATDVLNDFDGDSGGNSDDEPFEYPAEKSHDRSPSPPVRPISRDRPYPPPPQEPVEVIYPMSYDIVELENYEDFTFDCEKKEALNRRDSLTFDTTSLEQDNSPVERDQAVNDSRVKEIYDSRYTGDAETGGSHTAKLTEIHKGSGELYKWLHIQQDVMNFDEFWAETSRRIQLSDTERRATNRLRADVTRMCAKSRSNPKGVNVGYMEPHFLQIPLEPPKKKFDAERGEAAVSKARWVCMPFFVLKQYSGLLSGSSLLSFPSQTLLQAQYSRTTQQRDMAQAVCELGIAKKGECFHIEQLWCLILGDSVLVTCGNMPRAKLEGDIIKLTSEPSRGLSAASAPGRILVKFGNTVTWSFSPEECPTWFHFIAHFTAFWPLSLEFRKDDTVLTAADWPKLVKFLSTKRRKNVILTLNTDSQASPSRALAIEEEGKEAVTVTNHPKDPPLHVLTLIIQRSEGDEKPPSLESEIEAQLAGAEKFLTEQPAYSTQAAYNECPNLSRAQVIEQLRLENSKIEEEKNDVRRKEYDDGIELFNVAESLFELFLPLNSTGPTTGKFWAAILDLARGTKTPSGDTTSEPRYQYRELQNNQSALLRWLRAIYPRVKSFQGIMSYVPKEDRLKLEAPRKFVTAWLHLVSGLVLCRGTATRSWESHITLAVNRLLGEAMDGMIQALPANDLLDSVVLQPFEIVSLAVLKLIQDHASQPEDINETYSQYLASLDNDITTKPSDRSYQHRIDLVRRELSAIRRTVTRQRHIIGSMKQTMYPNPMFDFTRGVDDDPFEPRDRYGRGQRDMRRVGYYQGYYGNDRVEDDSRTLDYALKVSPTDKNGFRGLLLTEISRLLDQRDFEFKRFFEYVDDLERTVSFKMEWTKDRQENAVYAFTIVTIIFLPLSSIAGIFGMNTSDVRDMDYSQWLFWVVALPVTVLVIVVGLWWMNELGNVMRWLTGQSGASIKTGYGGVTAEPVEIQYYSDMEESRSRLYSRKASLGETPFDPYSGGRSEVRQRRMRMA